MSSIKIPVRMRLGIASDGIDLRELVRRQMPLREEEARSVVKTNSDKLSTLKC